MKVRTRLALVRATADVPARVAPKEIQLWDVGPNPTDYGVHVWNERSVREATAEYEARGNPLLIDVEHLGPVLKDGTVPPTGGYARLEIRSGAPWLVFEWSDFGRAQVESGERRYLSPEYFVDKATGEIIGIKCVSLVGSPGTHRARVLAAKKEKSEMDLKLFLAALRAALTAEDPKAGISSLIDEVEKAAGAAEGEGAAESSADVNAAGMADATGVETAAAGDEEKKDEVQATAPPATEEKKEPVAAAAKPAKSAELPAPIRDAVANAKAEIDNSTRDHILATEGDRLDPSIRRWAAAQPLPVVRGLLAATPKKTANAVARVAATRGETQGTRTISTDEEREREDLAEQMGLVKASAPTVKRTDTVLVIPTMTPEQVRAYRAQKGS